MADIDMFDLARKLAPDIEKNMPESVKEALEGGKIRSIFRTSASAGDTTPGSIYLTHDDGRVARYGRHGMGWDEYRADTVGGKTPLTKDDPWFFTRSLFHKKGTKNPSGGIPVSDLEDLIKKGDLLTNPIAGRMLFESREEAGVVVQIHAGDLLSDVYNRDGSVSFLDDLANRSRLPSAMPGVIEASIDDIELTERSAPTVGTIKKRQAIIPQLKSPVPPVAPPVTPPTTSKPPTGRLRGTALGSTQTNASPVGRLRGKGVPQTPTASPKATTAKGVKPIYLRGRPVGPRPSKPKKPKPATPRPGAIGGVKIGSPTVTPPPPKPPAKPPRRRYPSPLPPMYDSDKLNKMRKLPGYGGPFIDVKAAITAAPGSSPGAVAATAATTPAGASTAVKSFLKNKANKVSGSSVIKKFANRKSMAVSGIAAAGLLTSIATSKNRLQERENMR